MYPKINDLIRYEIVQPLYSEFIVELNGAKYPIKVNKTAAEIFRMCDGSKSIEEITTTLTHKYNEKYDDVKSVVETFIRNAEQMRHIQLLSERTTAKSDFMSKIGGEDYWTPELVAIELTHKCPLKCKHCYINAGTGENIDTNKVIEIIDECAEMGIDNIQFTGGEPLLHPDFFLMSDKALDKGLAVHIFTCGYIISDSVKKCLEKYRNNPKIIVQVSVDGMKETHDQFRGVNGCFDKTVEFIRMIVDLGIKLSVGTCISSQSYEELKQLSGMLKELGVPLQRYSPISDRGRAKENLEKNSVSHMKQIKNWIKDLSKEMSDEKFSVLYFEEGQSCTDFKYKHNCGLGQTNLKIDPDGVVYPCLMSDVKYANVNKLTLLEIQKKYSRVWEKIFTPSHQLCGDCEEIELCNNCVNEAMTYCKRGKGRFAQQCQKLYEGLTEEDI